MKKYKLLLERKNNCYIALILMLLLLNLSEFNIYTGEANSSTWTDSIVTNNAYIHNPLAVDSTGDLYTADVTHNMGGSYVLRVYRSTDRGNTWSEWDHLSFDNEPQGLDLAIHLYNHNVYLSFAYHESFQEGFNPVVYLWRLNDDQLFEVDRSDTAEFFDTSIAIDYAFASNNYIYIAYCSSSANSGSYYIKRAKESDLPTFNLWKYYEPGVSDQYYHYPELTVAGNSGDVYVCFSI